MRNSIRTVKGKWKLPFNILSTNVGEFVVYNYKNFYNLQKEAYWTIKANENGEYYVISVVEP